MTANYHTHTFRCHHALGTEREYIETAISRGLKVLGFSDHVPQLFPGEYCSHFRMLPGEAEDYVRTLTDLREEYKNDIEILIGFETEYYGEIFEKLIEFLKPYDIHYMILGQHYLDNEYDTRRSAMLVQANEEQFDKYINTLLTGIETGKFSYIAHPDIFGFNGDPAVYERQYRRLCEGAKKLNIPLEINIHGFETHRHYPSDSFFKIATEVGNSFILGCDAHEPDGVLNPVSYKIACGFAHRHGITPLERLELKKI